MEFTTAILSGFVAWLGGLTMLMFRMWLQERKRINGNPGAPYPLCDSHRSQLKDLSTQMTEVRDKVVVLWSERPKK